MSTTEQATTPDAGAAPSAAQPNGVAEPAPAQGGDEDISTDAFDRMPDPDAEPDESKEPGEGDDDTPAGQAKTDTGDGDEPDDEMVEVEYAEGKKVRIPKELQRGFLREADYTRKTQELAKHAKAITAEREAVTVQAEASKALLAEHVKVKSLEDRVEYYRSRDWDAIEADQGPEVAQSHWRKYQEAKDQLAAAKTDLETKTEAQLESQRKAAAAAHATAMQDTGKALGQEIEGWNRQVMAQVVQHGMEVYGIDEDEFLGMTDVRPWKALHTSLRLTQTNAKLAKENAELKAALKKQNTADTHETAAKPRPAASTKGAAPATGVRDEISTAEWMRRRNAQKAANAAR